MPAFLIALSLLSGCARHAGPMERMQASSASIPTLSVARVGIRAQRLISGIIAPLQNVAISSSLTEPAVAVKADEGDHVSQGQLLAILDTSDLRAGLAQAQSSVRIAIRNAAAADARAEQAHYQAILSSKQSSSQVDAARAALAQARHTLEQARNDLKSDHLLAEKGYIARRTLDEQRATVLNGEAQVRAAQVNLQFALTNRQINGSAFTGLQAANVKAALADARAAHAGIEQARAQVQQYKAQIAKAAIVSPVDGIVVRRNLNLGEYPGARTLFTIQQLDRVYAELSASNTDTFTIPVGAPATITIADDTHPYHGKVAAVFTRSAHGSMNCIVKVLLSNPDGALQPGLPATAVITLPPIQGPGVPATAFLDRDHSSLMLVDDNGDVPVTKTVRVHEIASNGTTSIVTGIQVGDRIVANGQLGIVDGQPVRRE